MKALKLSIILATSLVVGHTYASPLTSNNEWEAIDAEEYLFEIDKRVPPSISTIENATNKQEAIDTEEYSFAVDEYVDSSLSVIKHATNKQNAIDLEEYSFTNK